MSSKSLYARRDMSTAIIEIADAPFCWDERQREHVNALAERVRHLREGGELCSQALKSLSKFFRIKDIYNSNAIEGNELTLGETREVIERGLTLTGKSLKDQAEAKNLAEALDFMEELVANSNEPIQGRHIRELHGFVLKGIDDPNAGAYRSVNVEISGSAYRPPEPQEVPAQMEALSDWMGPASLPTDRFASPDGLLNALVAHTWFVQIHPFVDGNGRVGRLLMNLILMRYGYPIAIITKDDRERYYDALETSQTSDLSPVIALVGECVHESLEEYEQAATEGREAQEWTQAIAARLAEPEVTRAHNEYEVWKSAMDLMKGYFQQTADRINAELPLGRVYFTDFGTLELEKYLSLRDGRSAKRTWSFRIDFRIGERAARYLFWFSSPSRTLKDQGCEVTAHLSREEPEGSYNYERLDFLDAPNVPQLFEVGYRPDEERFAARYHADRTRLDRIEVIGKQFLEEVVKLHFQN